MHQRRAAQAVQGFQTQSLPETWVVPRWWGSSRAASQSWGLLRIRSKHVKTYDTSFLKTHKQIPQYHLRKSYVGTKIENLHEGIHSEPTHQPFMVWDYPTQLDFEVPARCRWLTQSNDKQLSGGAECIFKADFAALLFHLWSGRHSLVSLEIGEAKMRISTYNLHITEGVYFQEPPVTCHASTNRSMARSWLAAAARCNAVAPWKSWQRRENRPRFQ